MIQAVANATRAADHHRDRRLVRRRQLRHVRPRLRSALHLRLAQQPHRGDGRRAGGRRDEDRHRAEAHARRQGAGRRARARRDVQGDRRPVRPRDRRRSTPPPACGTTASSTRATRAASSPSRLSIAREADGAAAQSHHLRRRAHERGCNDDEVHARARGAARRPEDAHRPRDQSARRRVGGGGHLPRPRAVQEDGRRRPARPRQAGRVRRLGPRLLLRHGLLGIARPGERRLVPMAIGVQISTWRRRRSPASAATSCARNSWRRRSAATTSPASACRRPAPAPTSPRSRPRRARTAATT